MATKVFYHLQQLLESIPSIEHNLRSFLIALFDRKIAISTDKNLIITDGSFEPFVEDWNGLEPLLLDFTEESGRSTALKWLNSEVVCVGFETGIIACFFDDGTSIIEFNGHESSVQAFRISNKDLQGLGAGLWILYEGGMLICVPIQSLLGGVMDGIVKFKIIESTAVSDFVFLPSHSFSSSYEASLDISHCVLTSGINHSLSLYTIGGKLHFQHLGKLAGYVKDKVGSAVSKTLSAFFGGSSRVDKLESETTTLTSHVDFEDPKRRILRLSIDPREKLVAAADSLGRVSLYDTRVNSLVRLWKGLRDARLAWCEHADDRPLIDEDKHTRIPHRVTLCLAIYAPQIGLLSMYAMKHGPCLRVIPVGPQAQIMTILQHISTTERRAQCILFRCFTPTGDATGQPASSIEMSIVSPFDTSEADLNPASTVASSPSHTPPAAAFIDCSSSSFATEAVAQPNEPKALATFEKTLLRLLEYEYPVSTFSSTSTSLGRREQLQGSSMSDIESELLAELASVLSPWGIVSCVDLVDSVERMCLRGLSCGLLSHSSSSHSSMSVQRSSDSPLHSHIDGLFAVAGRDDRALTAGSGISTVCFSVNFHKELLTAAAAIARNSLNLSLKKEVRIRLELLEAYEALVGVWMSSDATADSSIDSSAGSVDRISPRAGFTTGTASSLDPSSQDIAMECRKNSVRAEAICWLVRSRSRDEDAVESSLHSQQQHQRQQRQRQQRESLRSSVQSSPTSKAPRPTSVLRSTSLATTTTNSPTMNFNSSFSSHGPPKDILETRLARASSSASASSHSDFAQFTSTPVATSSLSPLGGSASSYRGRSASSASSASSFGEELEAANSPSTPASFSLFRALHVSSSSSAGAMGPQEASLPSPVAGTPSSSRQLLFSSSLLLSLLSREPYTRSRSTTTAATSERPQTSRFLTVNISLSDTSVVRAVVPRFELSLLQQGQLTTAVVMPSSASAAVVGDGDTVDGTERNQYDGSVSVSVSAAAESLLSLVTVPLVGDAFALHEFQAVAMTMGLAGGVGLRRLLPLVAASVERLPRTQLLSLMMKQLASNPFQRWLRDTLLTFQDDVASAMEMLESGGGLTTEPCDSMEGQGQGQENGDVQENGVGMCANDSRDDSRDADIRGEDDTLQELIVLIKDMIRREPTSSSSSSSGGGGSNSSSGGSSSSSSSSSGGGSSSSSSSIGGGGGGGGGDASTDSLRQATFDKVVEHVLHPALLYLQQSPHLEASMAFVALVVEALVVVGGQVERRSYGAQSLASTIATWKLAMSQLRVLLFVSARIGAEVNGKSVSSPIMGLPLTIENMDSGRISLYAMLAMDTLCFSVKAEQAQEHERRCSQVYEKRTMSSSGDVSGERSGVVATGGAAPLLAWGAGADARWRELLQVADTDEGPRKEKANERDAVPHTPQSQHVSSPSRRGRDRSDSSVSEDGRASLSVDPKKLRRRRPLLLFFPHHNHPDSPMMGAYRSITFVEKWLRKPRRIDHLTSASAHLFGLSPGPRAAVALYLLQSALVPVLQTVLALEEDSSKRVEMNGNVGEIVSVLTDQEPLQDFSRTAVELLQFLSPGASSKRSPTTEATPISDSSPSPSPSPSPSLSAPSSSFVDCWPPVRDVFLQSTEEYFAAFSHSDKSKNRVVRLVFAAVWMLQLRSQCALKGIKPSLLFSRDDMALLMSENIFRPSEEILHDTAATSTAVPSATVDVTTVTLTDSTALENLRHEFLLQCFRRLEVGAAAIAYKLADAWALKGDDVRITNITSLLERGNVDELVEEIIPHISPENVGAAIECVAECLRVRLGGAIVRMERLPQYGKFLAMMDAGATAWARSAAGPLDVATAAAVVNGNAPLVNFNVATTRHLIVRIHSLLLSVPADSDRRDRLWEERRTKYVALLGLATAISNLTK